MIGIITVVLAIIYILTIIIYNAIREFNKDIFDDVDRVFSVLTSTLNLILYGLIFAYLCHIFKVFN